MNPKFSVTIDSLKELKSMPDSWPSHDLRDLLKRLEIPVDESLGRDDLHEFVVMALQDCSASEAAKIVLAQTLATLMNAGQIQNLAEEMKEDRKWEEASDMRYHEPIFNAQVLLSEAFPRDYDVPDILRVTTRVTPLNQAGGALLQSPVSEAWLVRLLADGMPASAVLKRLFVDALAKGPFPEAAQIIWQFRTEPDNDGPQPSIRITVYAPHSWFGPLEAAAEYESSALPDLG